MIVGASWSLQLIAFAEAFALGIAGGIPSLLFLRKARPLERALTDFTAVLCNLALYLLAIQLGADGAVNTYTIVAYALGLMTFFKIKDALLRVLKTFKNKVTQKRTARR